MATSLSVNGETFVSWSLSDADGQMGYAASSNTRAARTVSNGTGTGQSNVAWSGQLAWSGTGVAGWNIHHGLTVTPFNASGYPNFVTLRELLLQVVTGPTGSYVSVRLSDVTPTAPANFPLSVGGQLHFCDYSAGMTVGTAGSLEVKSSTGGNYAIDVTAIGVGDYATTEC